MNEPHPHLSVALSVMSFTPPSAREITHPEVGREVLDKFVARIRDVSTVERAPALEGRMLSVGAWSEDESCPPRNVAQDTLAGVDDGEYCAR